MISLFPEAKGRIVPPKTQIFFKRRSWGEALTAVELRSSGLVLPGFEAWGHRGSVKPAQVTEVLWASVSSSVKWGHKHDLCF